MNTQITKSPRAIIETTVDLTPIHQEESLQQLPISYFIGKSVALEGKRAGWAGAWQLESDLDNIRTQSITLKVLRHVDAQSLGSLSQVSKFWNAQAHAARSYRVLDISRKNEDNLEAFLVLAERIVKSFKDVEHSMEVINAYGLNTHPKRLEYLVTWDALLMNMPKCLKNLKVLNLEGFDITRLNFLKNEAFKSAAKSLISLNLNSTGLQTWDLETVVNQFSELEELFMGDCAFIDLEKDPYHYGKNGYEYRPDLNGISNLLRLTKLIKLDLSKMYQVSLKSIQVLSKLKVLKTLILKDCKAIDDKCIEILNTFESLEYVDLRGTEVTTEGLQALNPNILVNHDSIDKEIK